MGIRAHPRLTSRETSLGHHGTQSHGCAGQTVRPSLHSISQALAGKLLILSFNADEFQFRVGLPVQRHVKVAGKDLPLRSVVKLDKVTFGM